MALTTRLSDEELRELAETYEQRYEAYLLEVKKDIEDFYESVRGKDRPAQPGTTKDAPTDR